MLLRNQRSWVRIPHRPL